MSHEPPANKKPKLELFTIPEGGAGGTRTAEEIERAYRDAVKSHPFFDNAHSIADVYKDGVLRDGKGNVLGVLVKQGLPEYATQMAADVLRPAATRTSLRANMYGGESPLSGIAGYFDYRGSPIEHKYRKTAFTYEHERVWPGVFPMIDYVSEIYKKTMPENWARQDAAIPDVVRIHGSPFSTLTINSRFRTAHHTDAGDFDDGYGCLACLEGPFLGLALTFDDFRVNFVMQPRDVLIFNTHHFHSNTEPESTDDSWKRLTCVFYYRAALGEPASYAEYRRRLAASQQKTSSPQRVISPITKIVEKSYGENWNRPAPVHKLSLTPFALTTVVHCLAHAGAAGTVVHAHLLAHGATAEEALFGEPLYHSCGIPARGEADTELLQMSPATVKGPMLGGFKENELTLQAASEKQKCLEPTYLADHVSRELLEMWEAAKAKWVELVGAEWQKMLARDAARTTFTWNNRSEMNSAFFDMCEVGKQVLLGLIDADTATPKEEQSFWAVFSAHCNALCVSALHMPPNAMSLAKLNVKIKDFNFGGTRYFKDMPPEEQQRRLQRKARIEEARRSGEGYAGPRRKGGDWLANDSFDYQTEDRPVDYRALGHVTPQDNANVVVRTPDEVMTLSKGGASGTGPRHVRILVVLPPSRQEEPSVGRRASPLSDDLRASSEAKRLLENKAAQAILGAPRVHATLPSPQQFNDADGNTISVAYTFTTTFFEHADSPYDFVVLQHVLSTLSEESLITAYVDKVSSTLATGAVLVAETDLQDRQFFRLKPHVREAYSAVALNCFQELHHAKFGVVDACLRTKAELERLLPTCCVRYKLVGSPLNTTLMILPGAAR